MPTVSRRAGGIGPVSYGDLIFPGQSFYVEGEQRFDVSADEALDTASALLDDAGWIMGADGVRTSQGVAGIADGTPFAIDVPYENSWAQARCNTEMLQQTLKPLGIAVTPEAYDAASFWTDVAADKFTFYHGGNSYATTDIYFAQTFMCDGSANVLLAKWCNPEVDDLITKAQATSTSTRPPTCTARCRTSSWTSSPRSPRERSTPSSAPPGPHGLLPACRRVQPGARVRKSRRPIPPGAAVSDRPPLSDPRP